MFSTALLKKIDCLIINEDEARMLASESNLIKAGRKIIANSFDLKEYQPTDKDLWDKQYEKTQKN